MTPSKIYLGDSVYCERVGESLKLTTENGFGPSNEIWLDADVFAALLHFYRKECDVEITITPKRTAQCGVCGEEDYGATNQHDASEAVGRARRMLTREQVEQKLKFIHHTPGYVEELSAHDAALRAKVEAHSEAMNQWKVWCEEARADLAHLRACAEKERDELKGRVQRKPEEWETVCHECNGSGWAARSY